MMEDETRIEAKISKESTKESGSESGSESDSESESEEEDDALSYRPDAAALAKLTKTSSKAKPSKSSEPSENAEAYKPPKISAVAPPSATFSEKGADKSSNRKLQSMEEYLAENSELPQAEVSIGSSIVNNGRGGVKTDKDRQREEEIQTYEESNFTRLPNTQLKKSFKQKAKRKGKSLCR
ncbi:hypothetical protein QCA50_018595 [Cerrena zonata]|uniref:Uncharacterized protein n=1 Tax=Cerrena zonata TaxID=2478898 RepID=A0AAW0FH16_9APHY